MVRDAPGQQLGDVAGQQPLQVGRVHAEIGRREGEVSPRPLGHLGRLVRCDRADARVQVVAGHVRPPAAPLGRSGQPAAGQLQGAVDHQLGRGVEHPLGVDRRGHPYRLERLDPRVQAGGDRPGLLVAVRRVGRVSAVGGTSVGTAIVVRVVAVVVLAGTRRQPHGLHARQPERGLDRRVEDQVRLGLHELEEDLGRALLDARHLGRVERAGLDGLLVAEQEPLVEL